MLQWMGGSRRKVATSRKSTQKRQKQYFEQRKRQQQNMDMEAGSVNHDERPGINGQSLNQHRSLDIINLLNLSKNAQESNYLCQKKRRDDGDVSSAMPGSVSTNQPRMFTKVETTVNSCGFEEKKAEAPLCCQIETSPKKVSVSASDQQYIAFNGPSSHWKPATDQYSELSVIDLLCDDEPNPTEKKSPTCEEHLSFSVEGLGKVGTETPVHSPLQRARSPYRKSPLLKGGRKTKSKNLNHVLGGIELEVDAMMQDIRISPVNYSSFPSYIVKQGSTIDGNCEHFNDDTGKHGSSFGEEFFHEIENNDSLWNVKQSSAMDGDCKLFYDHTDKSGASIREEFLCKTENNENTCDARSIFHDEEMGYCTSCKNTFQTGRESPELMKRGAYKMESYAFEDLLPRKWSSAMKENNMDGLGKVGTETPVHSPLQRARSPYRKSPLLKGGRKTKSKNINPELGGIELEVDAMMQDIRVSPVNYSSFPSYIVKQGSTIDGNCEHFNDDTGKHGSSFGEEFFHETENNDSLWNVKQSSAMDGDCKLFYDHTDKSGSSIREEFLCKTENNENTWDARSIFHDEEMGYCTSCKNTFQTGRESPELMKRGAYKMESYAFEDLLPTKWSSAMKEKNMDEPMASFSTDQLEDDFNLYGTSRERSRGKYKSQNLVPGDVRDDSSLLSEESTSSTAARSEYTVHSSSRIVTGENRRKHKSVFASPRNKCSANEEKCRSLPNLSKRKSSHYSNSMLQEEMCARNNWQFEERYASLDRGSVTTSFCQDLEANFSVFGCEKRAEDPFSDFITPESRNKASYSIDGFKNTATLAESPPCSFNSEKFAFDCSNAFPNFRSLPTSPRLSPDFQFKEGPRESGAFHCDTSSTGMSVQGSVSKGERKMKLQHDKHTNFEQENIFMGDNDLSSEKEVAGDAPTSDDHAEECEGTEDTNPKTTLCLETADSPVHVDEISSSLKKPGKPENRVANIKTCDAETPFKYKITKKEMKVCPPEGRSNDQICVSGQVMFEGYFLQLLHVQKVVKEACTTSKRNNTFLGPSSSKISHLALENTNIHLFSVMHY